MNLYKLSRSLLFSPLLLLAVLSLGGPLNRAANPPASIDWMDQYNVVWTTPGKDFNGSMPLGNGDIGINAWVEENKDLVFYISKNDAWVFKEPAEKTWPYGDWSGRLYKLGRIRVSVSPNPFTSGTPFRQTLKIREGILEIEAGKPGQQLRMQLWVDALQPVIRLEATGQKPFTLTAAVESWRPEDVLVDSQGPGLTWYYRNTTSPWTKTLEQQGLTGWAARTGAKDPVLNRTFGCRMEGTGWVKKEKGQLQTTGPRKKSVLSFYPYTAITDTPSGWLTQLENRVASHRKENPAAGRQAHLAWWRAFWNRSWIRITSNTPEAYAVNQGYLLQRFLNAAGGRGTYPIQFCGSIFNVETADDMTYQYTPEHPLIVVKERNNPDYRRWGGNYWMQNTRLIYWPMLAAGDFDLMRPFFSLYRRTLDARKAHTPFRFPGGGAYYPETMTFWGTAAYGEYAAQNVWTWKHLNGSLELIALMLDYHAFTGSRPFLTDTLLPVASEVLRFWDRNFGRDRHGNLFLQNLHALETYRDVDNPACDVAGLRWNLTQLLSLPIPFTGDSLRREWHRLAGELPGLPVAEQEGGTLLLPALPPVPAPVNAENPELYAVFPYRLFRVGQADDSLASARYTFGKRLHRRQECWGQDGIWAACLGLPEAAKTDLVHRFTHPHQESRFPAFFGKNSDWVPDQDHGGAALLTLQTMLLQADGQAIRVLPAWPREWDVAFRLHAPGGTVVEGEYAQGQLNQLRTFPENRKKDIIIPKGY